MVAQVAIVILVSALTGMGISVQLSKHRSRRGGTQPLPPNVQMIKFIGKKGICLRTAQVFVSCLGTEPRCFRQLLLV